MKILSSAKRPAIRLSNGKFLIEDRQKCGSDLLFISETEAIDMESTTSKAFNLSGGGSWYFLIGEFFISKKGRACFRVNPLGDKVLIANTWGGPFNWDHYRGRVLSSELDGVEYFHRGRTNGGGMGVDYAIVSLGWYNLPSEEDL